MGCHGNGIQNTNEIPVEGAKVELLHDDVVIRITLTDGSGKYLFDELAPGSYQVRFTAPGGYLGFTMPNQGDDAGDSDAIAPDARWSVSQGSSSSVRAK